VKTIAWSATQDPAARAATGDVVWSESRQQGFLRIRGLAANDPKATQYQLWIFDARRDAAHPVDGGVFDVVDGEVVVPIRAAIRVFEPKLFAVTVERPGGVVVSKRERIVLTAAL
jgi:anti-sigma-K factor RskA